MKYKLIVVLLGILIISGIAVAVDTFGNFEKNDDGTFTETKQVIVTKVYPDLVEIDKQISDCQAKLSIKNRYEQMYNDATDEIERQTLWLVIPEFDCSQQLQYLQDLRTKIEKIE
jgi:hypothetical protein